MPSVNIFAAIARLDLGTLDALKVEAQEKKLDFHKLVTSRVLGISMDAVTLTDRNQAKNALFMYMYGRVPGQ